MHYFGSYPKRYLWSARPRRRRMGITNSVSVASPLSTTVSGMHSTTSSFGAFFGRGRSNGMNEIQNNIPQDFHKGSLTGNSSVVVEETVQFGHQSKNLFSTTSLNSDEAAVSSAMSQLRNQGVVIVAHGSRGRPKTVRLQLTQDSITWRTETRRKSSTGQNKEIKLGKLHSVSMTNIMYVDVGKQTTALRRSENASVPETLCFSLLTKEGSLDLEANSPRERDALVGSFSLVLDDVHAQNWRDIYRSSNENPSSFDEYDEGNG